MDQYPQNPPSYESVVSGSTPEQISATTYSQPTIEENKYPILPSAPMEAPPQNYGSISQITTSHPANYIPPVNNDAIQIINVNGCPICRIGVLESDFSCLGICLAIVCFPIGILCCLAMRNKRCTNCGVII